MKEVIIQKRSINKIEIKESSLPELSEGQICLSIDHFAFTSNNITYAVIGEKFRYWDFFPVSETKGIIPAWGFGTVIFSTNDDVKVGERFYGYFPMASHLVIQPGKVNAYAMFDIVEHRKELPSFYNYYEKATDSKNEKALMLFNPLFATSFLLSEFYVENEFFESENIILTSASSKTAIALAYLLSQTDQNINVFGFTSETNLPFVESLDIYDRVFTYDEISSLDQEDSCIVDFAGNKSFMLQLQNHLIPNLKFCSVVGLSHWDKQSEKVQYPFKAELFFAPAYGAEKMKLWGIVEYKKRLNSQLDPFLEWTSTWLEVDIVKESQIAAVYTEMLAGNVNPKKGIIMSLSQ